MLKYKLIDGNRVKRCTVIIILYFCLGLHAFFSYNYLTLTPRSPVFVLCVLMFECVNRLI